MTIGGTDASDVNTLAEWIDAAETMLADDSTAKVLAFEFNSNTYVVSDATDDSTAVVVELTGTTSVTSLSTTAGANVIDLG